MNARLRVNFNRFPQMGDQFERRVADTINNGILNTLMYADASTPRDTGALVGNKTTLYASAGNLKGSITWNQEYAGYVHDGTTRMEGRPFAADAIELITPDYLADLASLGLI